MAISVTGTCYRDRQHGDGSAPARPNVVLVSIDTLRADFLGCYGCQRPITPLLDALAATATRYTRALASSPWTLPSHASLFTGLAPYEHGVQTGFVPPDEVIEPGLAEEHLTLAEALASEGYSTGAFVANVGYLHRGFRLDQGFGTYETLLLEGRELNQHATGWLASQEDPFFLFVNYMDCHRPYNLRGVEGVIEPPADLDTRLILGLYAMVMPAVSAAPEELVNRVIAQYQVAVANADAAVGALVDWLRDNQRYDNTLLIVTSDHGEYFGEHYLVEHSKDIYHEALWVPLIVKHPGQRHGSVVDTPIASADIPKLVLDCLPRSTRESYREQFPGTTGPIIAENRFSRAKDLLHPIWGHRFRRSRVAVVEWPYKLIVSSDGNHELYDLEADPREARNLFTVEQPTAARLLRSWQQLTTRRPGRTATAEAVPLTPEMRRQLEELGYLQRTRR